MAEFAQFGKLPAGLNGSGLAVPGARANARQPRSLLPPRRNAGMCWRGLPAAGRQGAGESGTMITIPVAWGELIDKITILEIKSERMSDAAALANVRRELAVLVGARDAHASPNSRDVAQVTVELKAVNGAIWELEDKIRACERAETFGPAFVDCARQIYRTNDRRAALKREINRLCNSELIEEKSYSPY
jgi:hypothetical protein